MTDGKVDIMAMNRNAVLYIHGSVMFSYVAVSKEIPQNTTAGTTNISCIPAHMQIAMDNFFVFLYILALLRSHEGATVLALAAAVFADVYVSAA